MRDHFFNIFFLFFLKDRESGGTNFSLRKLFFHWKVRQFMREFVRMKFSWRLVLVKEGEAQR